MRLLIVENDEVVARVWRRFFRKEHEVFVAGHAPEAIELLKREQIDALLLDLRLNGPTPSGLEVYNFVRHNKESTAPITFITGLDRETELFKQAQEAAAKDQANSTFCCVMVKPVSIKTLIATIKEMQNHLPLSTSA